MAQHRKLSLDRVRVTATASTYADLEGRALQQAQSAFPDVELMAVRIGDVYEVPGIPVSMGMRTESSWSADFYVGPALEWTT